MEVAELNRLRRTIRSHWEADGDRPVPLVHLSDDEGDRDSVLDAFKTVASEIGIRHLRIDLSDGLTEEHRTALERKAPRLIVITSIDRLADEERPTLHDRIASSARTLPVVVGFLPAETIPTIQRGWALLQTERQAGAIQ